MSVTTIMTPSSIIPWRVRPGLAQQLNTSRFEVLDVDGVVDVAVWIEFVEPDADRELVFHGHQGTGSDAGRSGINEAPALCEVGLAPRFVDDDRRGVRKVQGPTSRRDRNAQPILDGGMTECLGRQPV